MIRHSIKWRLQAWHGFLLVCLVSGLMFGFYTFERRARLQGIDSALQEAVTPLLPKFAPMGPRGEGGRRGPPPPGEGGPRFRNAPPNDRPPENRPPEDGPPGDGPPWDRPPEILERDLWPFDAGKFYYAAWLENGERIAVATNAPGEITRPEFKSERDNSLLRTRGENRELAHRVPSGRVVLVGASLTPTWMELRRLAVALAAIGCAIILVGLGVGWWTASRALRPIAEISRAAQEIAAGDLANRINTSEAESELGQLAAVLNSTFARLDAAFAQQKQFTSDAAHELRTPVSVILTQTQSTLNKERSAAEYRETLEACQRAAQRMRRLIESLLQLARLDAGQENLKREELDLAHTAADCVELIRPLANERHIRLHLDCKPTNCQGDADRLALVVTNLLTNAVHHGNEGGEVRVSTRNGKDSVILSVADNGPGIAAEHLPHLFDRFYRADAARTTAQGHSGLGLAISKAIVEAHGGALEVVSQPDAGATFTVRLPA